MIIELDVVEVYELAYFLVHFEIGPCFSKKRTKIRALGSVSYDVERNITPKLPHKHS